MKQSGYLAKQQEIQNRIMHAAEAMAKQYMVDTAQIALHRLGWGFDRIMRFSEEWQAVREEYRPALDPKNPEADVEQEHMDMALSRIINGRMDLIPFYERYPGLKKVRY